MNDTELNEMVIREKINKAEKELSGFISARSFPDSPSLIMNEIEEYFEVRNELESKLAKERASRIGSMVADELENLTNDDVKKISREISVQIARLCESQSRYATRWGYGHWTKIPEGETIYAQVNKEQEKKDKLIGDLHFCDCLLHNRKNTIKIVSDYQNKKGIFAPKKSGT